LGPVTALQKFDAVFSKLKECRNANLSARKTLDLPQLLGPQTIDDLVRSRSSRWTDLKFRISTFEMRTAFLPVGSFAEALLGPVLG
jgi:hypothetical protein